MAVRFDQSQKDVAEDETGYLGRLAFSAPISGEPPPMTATTTTAARAQATVLLHERVACPQCSRKQMYFCRECLLALPGNALPRLALPLPLDIVHHVQERRGKSSAVGAAVLAPDCIRFVDFDPRLGAPHPASTASTGATAARGAWGADMDYSGIILPDYDPEETLLLFPADDAMSVASVAADAALLLQQEEQAEGGGGDEGADGAGGGGAATAEAPRRRPRRRWKRLVCIDSTWAQSRQMMRHPTLARLPRVCIKSHATAFWRPNCGRRHRQQQQQPPQQQQSADAEPGQALPPRNKRKSADISNEGLATVEAIYFFYRELLAAQARSTGTEYAGEVDDLLLLFALQHQKVQRAAAANKKKL
jgi:hypothetical protein